MGLLETLTGRNNGEDADRSLREELQSSRWQADWLQENLRQLELAMSDDGWRKLGSQLEKEFTREGLDDLTSMSRAMYLSNPLISRAVNVTTYYTWAQGVNFKAEDDRVQEELIEPMMEDHGNRAEIYGHQARILTDIDQIVDGNTFTALFTDDDGFVSVRSIPAEQIRRIHAHPEDHAQIQYYRRRWTERLLEPSGEEKITQRETLYPDWRFNPDTKPTTIGDVEVVWNAPIIHQRTGGLKQMMFGIPETYAAIDWARAYKRFLEDWHTIVASLARFAWKLTTTAKRVEDSKARIGAPSISEREENPTEGRTAPGGVFIHPTDTMEPIPKTGATTSAEDAKPSRMMVASAMGLPDTILSSDPQQGNLATAKTLDRPTELGFVNRQTMWSDWHKDIFAYAIQQRVKKAGLGKDTDINVDVSFPPILEHDVKETVGALVSAATLDGKAEAGTMPREELARKLMEAVDVDDIEQALKDAEAERIEMEQKAADQAKQDAEDAAALAQAANNLGESLR